MYNVTEINTLNRLHSLKNKWNTLLNESYNNNMFMTLEWLTIWWKQYGRSKELKVLIVNDEKDEVICIAPLMISKRRFLGFNLKVIELIGMDRADYIDFIIKNYNEKVFKAIFQHLISIKWDLLDLQLIPENSPTIKYLTNIATNYGFTIEKSVKETSPYVILPNTWEEYKLALSGSKRYNLSRNERKLKKRFKAIFKEITEQVEIEKNMEIFTNMHQKLWEGRKNGFTFSNKKFKTFLFKVAQEFSKKKWLYLVLLEGDNEPIAMLYGFKYGNRLYLYLSAYDLKYRRFSPGNVIILYIIKNAIEQKYEIIDFLKGGEYYKSTWSCNDNKLARLIIGGKSISSKIFMKAYQTRNIIKRKEND